MINRVEISPSSKAICIECKKKIKRLEIRGYDYGFICSKCLNFNKIRKELDKIERKFTSLNKMSEEEKENFFIKLKVMNKLR